MKLRVLIKRVRRTVLSILLIVILVPTCITVKRIYDKVMALSKLEQQLQSKEQQYLNGLEYLTQAKWADAEAVLQKLQDYKDAQVLAIYAKVQELIKNQDFQAALSEISKIPANYNGRFTQDIQRLKTTLGSNFLDRYSKRIGPELKEFSNNITNKLTN